MMLIEKATQTDIAELCQLLATLFNQEAEFKANRAMQEKGLHDIIMNADLGIILVARDSKQIVGMVNLLFTVSTALGGRVAILEDMVVLPSKRGVGVGSALLAAAITTAKNNGCLRITLLTDNTNTAAQTFYKKQGFVASPMLPFRLMLI